VVADEHSSTQNMGDTMKQMSLSEAVQILVDISSRWGENAEEEYSRRINANDDDEALRALVNDDRVDEQIDEYRRETAIEIRDLWRAIEIANREFNNKVEGAPR
jgi:hypothetical protein